VKIFGPLSEADERDYFFQKLRPQLQRELKSHNKIYENLGVDQLATIEDIFSQAKTIEESKGLNTNQVNFSKKKRFPSSQKGTKQDKIVEDLKKQIFILKKKLEQKALSKFEGNCHACGEYGHKKASCPRDKKINAVSKYPLAVHDLPIVDAKLKHGDGDRDIRVLLDMGSNLTLADNKLVSRSKKVQKKSVRFGGVGSSGFSDKSGELSLDVGGEVLNVKASFTDLPKDMDVILGLDSGLSRVDLDLKEATVDGKALIFHVEVEAEEGKNDSTAVEEEVNPLLMEEELDQKVQSSKDIPELIQKVLEKHAAIFAVENWSTISTLPPVTINLTENAVPVRCPLIKQSEEDEEMLESEVKEMLTKGIVSKVEQSRWVFPYFIAKSRNTRRKMRKRAAGDFRKLNQYLKFEEHPFPIAEELIDEIDKGVQFMSSLDIATK
jgi:hypothetical protein